jgi:hypothetical protein
MCGHSTVQRKRLPREIADGVFWLGDCLEQRANGKIYHTYNAAFLLVGTEASMLIETGHPKDFPLLDGQLKELLAGRPPLQYLFVTHQETPHSGGLGRVLSRYPQAVLCGDLCDYHLAFPHLEGRLLDMKGGDSIDLGGRTFVAVEPVIRDLRTTWWGFDTKERVLFPGDGFAYSHYHEDGHCGLFAEEAVSLNLPEVSRGVCRPCAVLDQVHRHEPLCRPAAMAGRRTRRARHRPQPRPAHPRSSGDGAEGEGRAALWQRGAGIRDRDRACDAAKGTRRHPPLSGAPIRR